MKWAWVLAAAVFVCGCSKETPGRMREARSCYEAGAGYINQRLYDRAIEELTRAIELDPDYAEAYCDRGIALYMKGEHEDALGDFEKALEKDPTFGKAHFHRAILLDQAGMTSQAIDAYETFIRCSRRAPRIYVKRAKRRVAELRGGAAPLAR